NAQGSDAVAPPLVSSRMADRTTRVHRRRVLQLDPEDRRQAIVGDALAHGRVRARYGAGGSRAEQLRLVYLAEHEVQLRLGVETDAHAVEDRGDVLAHARRVRARAVERHLAWLREESVLRVGQHGQHLVGQLTAQQANERADPAGAASD